MSGVEARGTNGAALGVLLLQRLWGVWAARRGWRIVPSMAGNRATAPTNVGADGLPLCKGQS